MTTIKDLKTMIKEPASKEWFAKHGNPKSKALHKASSRYGPNELKKFARQERETSHDTYVDNNPREHYNK